MDTGFIIGMVVLGVLGGYIVTSIFLLKFPNLLHRRKKLGFKAVHISHRGGAGENCENTMTAFRHALKQGTDMFELDCHLTKDGVVVVSHDQSLCRGCDINANIADVDYKDLPIYKPKQKLDFQSSFTLECGEDRRIPTLKEVFTEFPSTPINIDCKVHDEELFCKVNELVKEFNRESLVIWGSGRGPTVQALHKLNPEVPFFFSAKRVLVLFVLFYTGLLPFVPLTESSLEIIMPSIAFDKKKFSFTSSWKWRFALRVADTLMMRPALFKHLSQRGIQTYLWVLNDEKEFERAFKLGATGVMTDFPTSLTEYLRKNPQYWKTNTQLGSKDDI